MGFPAWPVQKQTLFHFLCTVRAAATGLRTSHLKFNLGSYGNTWQQFSQAAIAVVTAVGTVVAVVVDVNVAG